MEQKRLCPYCMGELPPAADSCVHCGKVFAGRNPAGCLPVGTVLAGRYNRGRDAEPGRGGHPVPGAWRTWAASG